MFKDVILENQRRREIYEFVKANPGFHLRGVQKRLNIPLASLEYHLDYMVKKNIVLREKNSHYTRYYAKPLGKEYKNVISILRQKRLRQIVLITLTKTNVKYQELLETLNIPPSTLSYYIKYLIDHNILERHKIGYENIYTIQDERVAEVLIAYKSSFIDRLVDKAIHTLMETQFRKKEKDLQK